LKKGFFPYLFNTEANQGIKDIPYPSVEYYGCDFMQPETRTEFLKWHAEQKYKFFNLQKEIEDYFLSDVDILIKSCLTYRDIF
jgi:hypothetical protein